MVKDWELRDTKDVLAWVLPWDIEMVIEGPEPECAESEDGDE